MLFYYETERLELKVLDEKSAAPVLDFYRSGKDVFDAVEPVKSTGFYTPEYQEASLRSEYDAFMKGIYMRYFWALKDNPDKIIGTCSFSDIKRGAFNWCTIGYKLLPEFWHHGYALEALSRLVSAIFHDERLHRIKAYVLPGNRPSINLLTRLGFEFECVEKSAINLGRGYLDHILYALINPMDN